MILFLIEVIFEGLVNELRRIVEEREVKNEFFSKEELDVFDFKLRFFRI